MDGLHHASNQVDCNVLDTEMKLVVAVMVVAAAGSVNGCSVGIVVVEEEIVMTGTHNVHVTECID